MVNICIFDAYGTLFDVTSATRIVANEEEYSSFPIILSRFQIVGALSSSNIVGYVTLCTSI
jgi:FMN phosphatase YigB (HAD superfamily)